MLDNFAEPEPIYLKDDPDYDKRTVCELIAKDPSLLGIGDLDVYSREYTSYNFENPDFVLDSSNNGRYVVNLQFGRTDPNQIIRTIDQCHVEKVRHPKFAHCAVLVAENISGELFNVVSIISNAMPFIVIKMQAFRVGDNRTLVFTPILNEQRFGASENAADPQRYSRPYWEQASRSAVLDMADHILEIIKRDDKNYGQSFFNIYIAIVGKGESFEFIQVSGSKQYLELRILLPQDSHFAQMIEDAEIESSYIDTLARYRLQLSAPDAKRKKESLEQIIVEALDIRTRTRNFDRYDY